MYMNAFTRKIASKTNQNGSGSLLVYILIRNTYVGICSIEKIFYKLNDNSESF